MMGSRGSNIAAGSLKRKREPETTADETSTTDYFFAKFLTNPDLLDLEVCLECVNRLTVHTFIFEQIADTHFRRQFLFQLLILLNHLLTFTKNAKSTWSTPRNRSLQMDFTLDGADAQWVQETLNKAIEELRQTTPNGRAFADTVSVILEREKNWVKWKNELCAPFDKEPWSVEIDGKKVDLEESTREIRKKMREEPKDWEWALGSEPLTEIWEMGYRDLRDLQNPFQLRIIFHTWVSFQLTVLQTGRREGFRQESHSGGRTYSDAQEETRKIASTPSSYRNEGAVASTRKSRTSTTHARPCTYTSLDVLEFPFASIPSSQTQPECTVKATAVRVCEEYHTGPAYPCSRPIGHYHSCRGSSCRRECHGPGPLSNSTHHINTEIN